MNEYQFQVKIEDYKEKILTSYGEDKEDAKQRLKYTLQETGFANIQYIL